MTKRVYISADYSFSDGDRDVVNELNRWGQDSYHKVDFVDMAGVTSGSVSNDPNCRICDLKAEFNRQINASSAVIFVVGDKTATRVAGTACSRLQKEWNECFCTPYKQNSNGNRMCRVYGVSTPGPDDDVGNINSFSYLRHEFEQAKKKKKTIIILYNSTRLESNWLPAYMKGFESIARPFWMVNAWGQKVGNYAYIKEVLGFA